MRMCIVKSCWEVRVWSQIGHTYCLGLEHSLRPSSVEEWSSELVVRREAGAGVAAEVASSDDGMVVLPVAEKMPESLRAVVSVSGAARLDAVLAGEFVLTGN